MRKSSTAEIGPALTWPVQVCNGSLLCGQLVTDGQDEWHCWTRLTEMPDDPGEFTEFSPAGLAALIIRHAREFHPQ